MAVDTSRSVPDLIFNALTRHFCSQIRVRLTPISGIYDFLIGSTAITAYKSGDGQWVILYRGSRIAKSTCIDESVLILKMDIPDA